MSHTSHWTSSSNSLSSHIRLLLVFFFCFLFTAFQTIDITYSWKTSSIVSKFGEILTGYQIIVLLLQFRDSFEEILLFLLEFNLIFHIFACSTSQMVCDLIFSFLSYFWLVLKIVKLVNLLCHFTSEIFNFLVMVVDVVFV